MHILREIHLWRNFVILGIMNSFSRESSLSLELTKLDKWKSPIEDFMTALLYTEMMYTVPNFTKYLTQKNIHQFFFNFSHHNSLRA
jgi:fluoride ion exporter CrcB/FEX